MMCVVSITNVFVYYFRWQLYRDLPPQERSKVWQKQAFWQGPRYVKNSVLTNVSLFTYYWALAFAIGSLSWIVFTLLKLRGVL